MWADAFAALPSGPADPAARRARAAEVADWLRDAALPVFRTGPVPPVPALVRGLLESFPRPWGSIFPSAFDDLTPKTIHVEGEEDGIAPWWGNLFRSRVLDFDPSARPDEPAAPGSHTEPAATAEPKPHAESAEGAED